MKRAVGLVVVAVALTTGVAVAQQSPQPAPPRQEHHSHGGMCPMMGQGAMMGGMMQGGMMSGMMGMGRESDPRMLQMRGEMMKAMGDVMIKYGKTMEATGR